MTLQVSRSSSCSIKPANSVYLLAYPTSCLRRAMSAINKILYTIGRTSNQYYPVGSGSYFPVSIMLRAGSIYVLKCSISGICIVSHGNISFDVLHYGLR